MVRVGVSLTWPLIFSPDPESEVDLDEIIGEGKCPKRFLKIAFFNDVGDFMTFYSLHFGNGTEGAVFRKNEEKGPFNPILGKLVILGD